MFSILIYLLILHNESCLVFQHEPKGSFSTFVHWPLSFIWFRKIYVILLLPSAVKSSANARKPVHWQAHTQAIHILESVLDCSAVVKGVPGHILLYSSLFKHLQSELYLRFQLCCALKNRWETQEKSLLTVFEQSVLIQVFNRPEKSLHRALAAYPHEKRHRGRLEDDRISSQRWAGFHGTWERDLSTPGPGSHHVMRLCR